MEALVSAAKIAKYASAESGDSLEMSLGDGHGIQRTLAKSRHELDGAQVDDVVLHHQLPRFAAKARGRSRPASSTMGLRVFAASR